MDEKILTVTVPSYNVQAYLEDCLESFVNSEVMDDIEVLIVNDGSSDDTATIAERYVSKYENTFRLINKENGGHGSTINTGAREARGKYFKVVDEKGKNFLYNLLELVRKRKEDKINIARFAYLLGRMEPKVQRGAKKEEIEEKRDLHREFSRKMYEWIRVEKDAKELEMAIYLYVYTKREKEEHDGVNE